MFERLFRKKNIFSYVPAILSAFCSMVMGINPFSSAMYAVMVEEKIPTLIPFLITSVVQLIMFGYVNTLRFLFFVIIYSVIKAFSKKSGKYDRDDIIELLKHFSLKILISALVSEGILLITRIEELSEFWTSICFVIATVLFSIVFSYAMKYYYKLIKENDAPVKYIHVVSFLVLCVVVTSFAKEATVLGINLWIAISIILLMVVTWRKSIIFSIISSLLVSLTMLLCADLPIGIVILILVVGITSTLLSKAGRKGALIGLVFSFIVLVITLSHSNNDNLGINDRVQEDYYNFLKNSQVFLSGEELEKVNEEITRIETINQIQKESQNTVSSIVIKCMIAGFFILCLLPVKYLDVINNKVPDAPDIEQIRSRLFRVNRIYWLNPGKEEKDEEKKL